MSQKSDYRSRVIRQLGFALKDPNPNIRFIGLEGLQMAGETSAPEVLLPLLKDPDRFVKWKAIQVAGSLGVLSARDAIARHLMSPDMTTRFHAVNSLCQLGDPGVLPRILETLAKETSPRIRQAFIRNLHFFRDDIPWDFLSASARDEDLGVRLDTSLLLGRIAPDTRACDILVNLLERESNNHVFATALISLGKFRKPILLGYFQHSLLHRESRIRANAIEAMGELPFAEVEPVVLPYLRDPSNRVKANVLAIFFREGQGKRVFAEVRKLLASANSFERASAAWLVGEFGLPEFHAEILRLLEDDEVVVSDRAAWALIRIPLPGTFDHLHKAYGKASQWALSNILKAMAGVAGEQDLPKIVSLLQRERSPQHKAQLVDLLGKIEGAAVKEMVLPMRRDPDNRIRSSAYNFLAVVDGPEACLFLHEGLSDVHVKVRGLCGEWMMKLGDFRALKTLSSLLSDADKMQRLQAAHTLKEIAVLHSARKRDTP